METQQELADAFLKFLFEKFRRNLTKLGVRQHELYESFQGKAETDAQGTLRRIEFAYKLTGMFVDMGVGRGTRSGQQSDNAADRRLMGQLGGHRRKPKKWYSKTVYAQTLVLSELLAQHTGRRIAGSINEILPEKVNLEL